MITIINIVWSSSEDGDKLFTLWKTLPVKMMKSSASVIRWVNRRFVPASNPEIWNLSKKWPRLVKPGEGAIPVISSSTCSLTNTTGNLRRWKPLCTSMRIKLRKGGFWAGSSKNSNPMFPSPNNPRRIPFPMIRVEANAYFDTVFPCNSLKI